MRGSHTICGSAPAHSRCVRAAAMVMPCPALAGPRDHPGTSLRVTCVAVWPGAVDIVRRHYMSTLAPPMFPRAKQPATRPASVRVRPFGLTTAIPARAEIVQVPAAGLTLCPQRQVMVTADGEPFSVVPSMKSAFETTYQTREDSQLADDTDNDTD